MDHIQKQSSSTQCYSEFFKGSRYICEFTSVHPFGDAFREDQREGCRTRQKESRQHLENEVSLRLSVRNQDGPVLLGSLCASKAKPWQTGYCEFWLHDWNIREGSHQHDTKTSGAAKNMARVNTPRAHRKAKPLPE